MINGHHDIFTGQYWLVFDGTGSVWGDTGCYLVVLGQYKLVLIGIECYWVNNGLLYLYIEKINGDVNQPTNRPTDQQGEYRAICLFKC